jgi:hypothetical protein
MIKFYHEVGKSTYKHGISIPTDFYSELIETLNLKDNKTVMEFIFEGRSIKSRVRKVTQEKDQYQIRYDGIPGNAVRDLLKETYLVNFDDEFPDERYLEVTIDQVKINVTPLEDKIEYYISQLCNVRQNPGNTHPESSRGKAPHKPLLLITIINLIKRGIISKNKIEISDELENEYARLWRIIDKGKQPDIYLPFFYLQSDGFWKLQAKPSMQIPDSISSVKELKGLVSGAKLTEEFFYLLKNHENNKLLKDRIIVNYFVGDVVNELKKVERENGLTYSFNKICEFCKSYNESSIPYKTSDKIVQDVIVEFRNVQRLIQNKFGVYNVRVEYSKGIGKFPKVPYICILPDSQSINDGVYVGICFGKRGNGAVIGLMQSITNPKELNRVDRIIQSNSIDVDGISKNSRYNNAFANPKDFLYNKFDENEFSNHLRKSLEMCFNFLGISSQDDKGKFNDQGEDMAKSEYGGRYASNIDKVDSFLLIAIKTKPFMILAGISGSGKSRIVRTLAYQFYNNYSGLPIDESYPANFEMISVKPDWHDSSELLGYESRINGEKYILTKLIKFIVKAHKYPEVPFFLLLDEMNLAPVEQYFAEFLSVMESRRIENGKIITDALIPASIFQKYGKYGDEQFWDELGFNDLKLGDSFRVHGLSIPSNLVIMGTVNMDETTHTFSRKVLDRAMTIEMDEIDMKTGLLELTDWKYPELPSNPDFVLGKYTQGYQVYKELGERGKEVISILEALNALLEGSLFKIGYRVRDDFLIFCKNYQEIQGKKASEMVHCIDKLIKMKVLSRIEGDRSQTESLIGELIDFTEQNGYEESKTKLEEMKLRLENSEYTSYWK